MRNCVPFLYYEVPIPCIQHAIYCLLTLLHISKGKKKISQYHFMQAPKLFKQNIEMLYNITEMQTKIQIFFFIISKLNNHLPYYD